MRPYHNSLMRWASWPFIFIALIFIIWSIGGCTSFGCFRKTGLLQRPVKIRNLSELPWREQWQGIVFNGDKVGFTRLKINPAAEAGLYNIESETYLSVRFMGIDKMIHLIGFETVRPDLTLSSFHYELKMDAQPLWIDGDVREGQLRAILTSASKKRILQKPVSLVYPASTVNLYPLLKGLVVGDHYHYEVFDPQTQTLSEVEQTVEAFEQSHQLMIEPSFRIETVMIGQRASTWINLRGEAIFELGLSGIIIMYKEDESRARSYLSETAMGKKDFILDFSLVKTDKPLPCPREAVYLEAVITNFPVDLAPLNSFGQTTLVNKGDRSAPLYKINRIDLLAPRPEKKQPVSGQGEHIIDLLPTDHVESNHPDIRKKASEIVADTETPAEKVRQLVDWVSRNVKNEAVENFSALDVLKERRGECQSHTLLYIAMARAAGIPSRFVGGIVYLEGTGFLYHSWAESDLDGWVPVDPTFNQVGVDATHIKLVEGSDWTSLLPLGDFVGHIGIRINDYRSLCNP